MQYFIKCLSKKRNIPFFFLELNSFYTRKRLKSSNDSMNALNTDQYIIMWLLPSSLYTYCLPNQLRIQSDIQPKLLPAL